MRQSAILLAACCTVQALLVQGATPPKPKKLRHLKSTKSESVWGEIEKDLEQWSMPTASPTFHANPNPWATNPYNPWKAGDSRSASSSSKSAKSSDVYRNGGAPMSSSKSTKSTKSAGDNGMTNNRPAPRVNDVTLCYEDKSIGLMVDGSDESITGSLTSPPETIMIGKGESLHAKVVASTYSILDAVPIDESCSSILESTSSGLLGVLVSLRNIASNQIYDAFPAQGLELRFASNQNYYYFGPGQQQREEQLIGGGQNVGEFFFADLVPGEYQLQFQFFFESSVRHRCFDLAGVDIPIVGDIEAAVVLGPYVLSYQKVNLESSALCNENPIRRRTQGAAKGRFRNQPKGTSKSAKASAKVTNEVHMQEVYMEPPMPSDPRDINLCYREDFIESSAVATAATPTVSEVNRFAINFLEIPMETGEDLYVHGLISYATFFNQTLFANCEGTVSDLQQVARNSILSVQVVLESVLDGTIIPASPSSAINIRDDFAGSNVLEGTLDASISKALGLDGTTSGDFYFRDVGRGTFRLSIVLTLSSEIFKTCFGNDPTQYYNDVSLLGVGPRLFTAEKVNIHEQTMCATTEGRNRQLYMGSNAVPPDTSVTNLSVCYQDAFTYELTSAAQLDQDFQETASIKIDFGTVSVNMDEDLHVRLSLSSLKILFDRLDGLTNNVPNGCGFLQETAEEAFIRASVELRSTQYDKVAIPRPAQSIQLAYLGLERQNTNANGDFPYGISFGLGSAVQSTGEFYFINIPKGMYTLEFTLDLSTVADSNCRRRLQTGNVAGAQVVIGPHVVTVERINAVQSGQCQPIASTNLQSFPQFP